MTVGVSPDLTRYFGENNLANYENNEVLEILRDLYNITEEKTLNEKYYRLQNIYEEEVPYVGLYYNRQTLVLGRSLTTPATSNWYNAFCDIGNWHKKN